MRSRLLAGASRWLGPLARYREYGAIGNGGLLLLAGGAGLLLLAGGAVVFLPHQTGHSPRALTDDCGLVTCTATLPAAATGDVRPHASPRVQPRSPASTVASSTMPAPSPAGPATSGPPASPAPARAPVSSPSVAARAPGVSVTVSYAIDRRFQGIQGQFMIVNHGSAPVTGWELAVALPGDGNFRVWNAQSRVDGDTLIINAPPNAQALAPGAAQQVMIFAEGNNSNPVSCTFDGASVCQAQQQPQPQQDHHREHWGAP
jgi:hypothetical protein